MRIRALGFLLTLLVCVCRAHGPYDSSAQLIVSSDSLEFSATLGMDGARQWLRNAGLSETDTATALTVRGTSTFHSLSADLAGRLVELSAGGQSLKATRLRVITDGLEASFIATYSGSYSGEVAVRARYFDGVEALKPGAFVAMDENRNVKAQAAFSRGNAETTVTLGTTATVGSATAKPNAPSASAERSAGAHQHADHVHPSAGSNFWLIAGAIAALAAGLILWLFKLRHSR